MPLRARLAELAGSKWAPPLAAATAAAAALLALLGEAWWGATVFAYRDSHRVCLPARRFLAERLSRLEWPEWYPFDGLGGSFVGQVVTGAFHPTSLLHLVLPRAVAFNWSVGLAHLAALLGMSVLLRAWGTGRAASLAGGLAFSLSGYLVSMEATLPYLLSAAALPWALWGLERASSRQGAAGVAAAPRVAAAAALATMVLGGDPQAAFLAGLVCALAALLPAAPGTRRASLAGLAFTGTLALLLCGVQLLPAAAGFLEIGGAADAGEAQRWSLEPLRLLDLFVPHPFASPGVPVVELFGLHGFQSLWADSLFLGAPAMGLCFVALRFSPRRREVRLLAAVALGGLVLALGSHTPVWGLLQRVLPLWQGFRYPEKVMAFVSFALAGLAGLGAQAALDLPRARRALGWAMAACLLLSLAATAVASGPAAGWAGSLLLWSAGAGEAARAELAALMPAIAGQAFFGALLAGAALLAAVALRGPPRRAAAALVAMVGLTCLAGNRGLSRGYRVEPEIVFATPRVVEEARRREPSLYGRARFYAFDEHQVYPEPVRGRSGLARAAVRFDNANLVRGVNAEFEVESLSGYLPLTAWGRAARADRLLPDHVFGRAFNVRFLVERVPGAPTIEESFRLEEVEDTGARVRLVQAITVGSEEELSRRVRAPGFDPVRQVVVVAGEGSPRLPDGAPSPDARVQVLQYRPERLEVETWSATPCTLFVADRFAPGWTASVDGRAAAIVEADVVGRALAVPAGRHRVEMVYRAPGLRPGAALSLAGIVAAGVALALPGCLARWRTRRTLARPGEQLQA